MMLQEVRALPEQLPDAWCEPEDWHVLWHPAEKKGYSGVATFSRTPLKQIATGIDGADDPEGRVLFTRTDDVDLLNIYPPSGSSSDAARSRAVDGCVPPFAATLRRRRRALVLAIDLNIARSPKDIFRWRSNQTTSGFLPHEQEWMDALVGTGWTDLIEKRFKDQDGPCLVQSRPGRGGGSGMANRLHADQSGGITANLNVFVDREAGLEVFDHAPVVIDLDPVE